MFKAADKMDASLQIAIKVINKTKMDPEDLESLKNEVKIMQQVDHPNIVKLIDVFEDEGHWCLVMEYMEGGELFDQILQKERFSEAEAREATKSIIDAIAYCHTKGICHRDIKPENLLLKS